MKTYQEFGVYDFSDYAEEITGENLIKINGGSSSCNGSGPGNGGSSAASGGSGSKGSRSPLIGASSGSCGGGGFPSVPSGSSGNSGSGFSTSGSGSGSAPSSNTGNCGGSISSGAAPNVPNPGTPSGSTQTSSEYHGVPPQHWAALDEQKEKREEESLKAKDDYSKRNDWITVAPEQYKSWAEKYLEYQDKGHWEISGFFKEIYSNTPVNNGDEYYHNGDDWIWIDSNGKNKTLGQVVYSTTNGIVIGCGQNLSNKKGADPNNKGNWVRIQMEDGWIRDYYHFDSISVDVGDKVISGTRLGIAGNTGASTNPHLHIDEYSAMKPNDYSINSEKYLKKSFDNGLSYVYFRNPGDYIW